MRFTNSRVFRKCLSPICSLATFGLKRIWWTTLFNSSEKRLARVLLLLANFGKEGTPQTVIPKMSQETLAGIIGTTRSRVSFFMNRFRKLGFIEYNGEPESPQFIAERGFARLGSR